MRFLLLGLLLSGVFSQARAQSEEFPDEIEMRFEQVDQVSFVESRLRYVHPMGRQLPVIWTYWVEDIPGEPRDTIAIHALASGTSVDHAVSHPKINGCHLRRKLAPHEARFLDKLIDKAFFSDTTAEQRGCVCPKLDRLAVDPICMGGAPSYMKITRGDRAVRVTRQCGANDAFSLIRDFVEAMIHPIYSRPYESCAQNQTPQYIVSEENIEE